jgi:hypothetical protein
MLHLRFQVSIQKKGANLWNEEFKVVSEWTREVRIHTAVLLESANCILLVGVQAHQ